MPAPKGNAMTVARAWVAAVLLGCAVGPPPPTVTPHVSPAQRSSLPMTVPAPPGSSRLLVFISDLHFGPGRDSKKRWYKIEDFRWHPEFKLFLQAIDKEGQGKTDLVFLGDTLELWQSIKYDCVYPANRDYGCSARDASKRLRRILKAHLSSFREIGRFADHADNRVVFVPGNHDAALLFPVVAQQLLDAIASQKADHVDFNADGRWMSTDWQIVAEHGHQIGKEVNRFEGWPAPFLGPTTDVHILRPWGEQFVQKYYNAYEEEFPIIDNILEEGVGIRYAMKAKGTLKTAAAVGRFVGFMLSKLSWAQFEGLLGDSSEPPTWDIPTIRQQGDRFFLDSLPPDEPMRPDVAKALADGMLGLSLANLTDPEISEICDYRAALGNVSQQQHVLVTAPAPCPTGKLGAIGQALIGRARTAILAEYGSNILKANIVKYAKAPLLRLFVYGHTHKAESPFEVTADDANPWTFQVANTGAWQRVISPADLERLRCGRPQSEIIKLEPEALPPCYTAIVVKPYAKTPVPALRYWTLASTGQWTFSERCEVRWPCAQPAL